MANADAPQKELHPELICPGNEHGINKGKRHIGSKECLYCPAKVKRRKANKEVVLLAKHSWTDSSFRQLEKGLLIEPGETYEFQGLKVVNETGRRLWLETLAYGLGKAPL